MDYVVVDRWLEKVGILFDEAGYVESSQMRFF